MYHERYISASLSFDTLFCVNVETHICSFAGYSSLLFQLSGALFDEGQQLTDHLCPCGTTGCLKASVNACRQVEA
jgi:hypothetical protein